MANKLLWVKENNPQKQVMIATAFFKNLIWILCPIILWLFQTSFSLKSILYILSVIISNILIAILRKVILSTESNGFCHLLRKSSLALILILLPIFLTEKISKLIDSKKSIAKCLAAFSICHTWCIFFKLSDLFFIRSALLDRTRVSAWFTFKLHTYVWFPTVLASIIIFYARGLSSCWKLIFSVNSFIW